MQRMRSKREDFPCFSAYSSATQRNATRGKYSKYSATHDIAARLTRKIELCFFKRYRAIFGPTFHNKRSVFFIGARFCALAHVQKQRRGNAPQRWRAAYP
ncbi:hypothetical protein [Acidocella aminolytica]|uniref:hypothetical protein n=1 Tax=Acidocella aminolytica TaxID=33998 RepID=UPI00130DBD7D|nr:hypothetical protein [Acidocella aminolytica]